MLSNLVWLFMYMHAVVKKHDMHMDAKSYNFKLLRKFTIDHPIIVWFGGGCWLEPAFYNLHIGLLFTCLEVQKDYL